VYVRPADLSAIRAKLLLPEFADAWSQVSASTKPLCKALVYLLEENTSIGNAAVAEGLVELQACTDGRVFDQPFHSGACIYDWCYDLLTSTQKRAFIAEFERLAASHTPGYPAAFDSHAVVGHDTEGWVMSDQLPAGIAIYDESTTMYDAAAALFMDKFVPARDYLYASHMHHQGDSYIGARFQHDQGASWLFRRMGAGDVLTREQQYVPYQVIYHLRPDGQQMRSGDTYDDPGKSDGKALIAMLAGSYYEDPYLLTIADASRYYSRKDYYRVYELLCRPAGVASRPMGELPLTKYFAMPMGEMVARTGWTMGVDSTDAVVHMRIGGTFFGNHQRKDFGTFQIYYRGALAIASGVYEGDGDAYGSDHWRSYHHQTISHNGLLALDPGETMTTGGSAANDGGQRIPNGGADHPRNLDSLLNDGYADMGNVTAHAFGPDASAPEYSYIAGDITGAYLDTKVSAVTRAMPRTRRSSSSTTASCRRTPPSRRRGSCIRYRNPRSPGARRASSGTARSTPAPASMAGSSRSRACCLPRPPSIRSAGQAGSSGSRAHRRTTTSRKAARPSRARGASRCLPHPMRSPTSSFTL
jgi:heparin/heparan-sulfate lyase